MQNNWSQVVILDTIKQVLNYTSFNMHKTNNHPLLEKPLWQMTGEEFLQLNELTRGSLNPTTENNEPKLYAHGVNELATMLGCCQSTVYALKKIGVLDKAIVSQIGKRIIFDVHKARELADEYQKSQRDQRKESK